MEMHQLRYVVAVARMGTFSRAAEHCHVSQPSLSQQIGKLEEELGERLFVRLRREARLTAHGETFLRRAVRILDEVDAALREATEARDLLRGTVSLGVLPTIAPYLLPGLVSSFRQRHPGIELVVEEETTKELVKRVLACEVDFALASQPIRDARLEVRELFTEELLLALPPRHPLATRRTITVADLEHEPFIVMQEGHCLGDVVLSFCHRRDLRPHIRFRSAQLETIQALVRAGMGVSLIPAMAAASTCTARPTYRSLSPPRPERRIVAFWSRHRPLGRAASQLLELVASRGPRPASAAR